MTVSYVTLVLLKVFFNFKQMPSILEVTHRFRPYPIFKNFISLNIIFSLGHKIVNMIIFCMMVVTPKGLLLHVKLEYLLNHDIDIIVEHLLLLIRNHLFCWIRIVKKLYVDIIHLVTLFSN
jgi:hypothetical protein